MDESILFNKNICRVCLEEKVIFYWNEEIEFSSISYKDCYYKYIGSEANDQFQQKLCEICSNGFKNAYLLFEKASESLTLLQNALIMKENKSQPFSILKEEVELQISNSSDYDYKTCTFGVEIPTENNLNDIEKVECIARTDDAESLLQIEIFPDNREEVLTPDKNEIEKELFDKMKINESAKDILGQKNKISSKHGRRKNYLCAYCSLIVSSKTTLRDHEATHNKNRERKYTCSKCGIKLYTKIALKNHMEIHQENREKRFKCEFCDKAFFNRGACNVHRRIHLGLMVACPICSKEFYRQVDLDMHLPKHSTARLQKNVKQLKHTVQCEYCNKDVATTKWKEHKAVHLNQPVMKCTICEKDFFCRDKCVQHLNRLHRKTRDEYDDFIYSYVDYRKRMSHLMIKQQHIVRSIPKN